MTVKHKNISFNESFTLPLILALFSSVIFFTVSHHSKQTVGGNSASQKLLPFDNFFQKKKPIRSDVMHVSLL